MSEKKSKSMDAHDEDLDFTIAKPLVMNNTPSKNKTSVTSIVKSKAPKEPALKLEKVDYNARATRTGLYNELKKKEARIEEDLYAYASPVSRGIALIVDLAFVFGLVKGAAFLPPVLLTFVNLFLNKYKLVLIFPMDVFNQILYGASLAGLIFFFVIIPTAFFNVSLGKKLTGLRVRGVDKYTLSIGQSFKREIFFKPLSLLLIAGIVMPFFTKHKQSLHDRMADTMVVKE